MEIARWQSEARWHVQTVYLCLFLSVVHGKCNSLGQEGVGPSSTTHVNSFHDVDEPEWQLNLIWCESCVVILHLNTFGWASSLSLSLSHARSFSLFLPLSVFALTRIFISSEPTTCCRTSKRQTEERTWSTNKKRFSVRVAFGDWDWSSSRLVSSDEIFNDLFLLIVRCILLLVNAIVSQQD